MFFHRASFGPVDLAFTDRNGGVSRAPYDSLNLGLADADDPADRARNLRTALGEFAPDLLARPDFDIDLRVAQMHQVHGNEVDLVDDRRARAMMPTVDGLVSSSADVVLIVRMADCVPVLLADPEAGVLGAAHSGRLGMAAGILDATVAEMRQNGARSIRAWIGPHICGACYEVPAALQEEVAEVVPESVSTSSWGTPALDLGAGVRAQLGRLGVSVEDVSACTLETPSLYSYRRDGAASGRLAGFIRRRQ